MIVHQDLCDTFHVLKTTVHLQPMRGRAASSPHALHELHNMKPVSSLDTPDQPVSIPSICISPPVTDNSTNILGKY